MSQSLLPSSLLNQLGGQGTEAPPRALPIDRRSLIEQILCVILILLAVLGPIITQWTSDGASEGSSFRQISYIVLLGAVLVWAAPWKRGWAMLAMPLPMLVALGWCWISVIWAIEPDIAFRRLLLTTTMIWTAFLIVRFGGYRRTTDALRVAMVITLAINYVTVWTAPQVGVHLGMDSWLATALAGNWRGIMTHKNFAGAACALCILLFVFDARHINARIRAAVLLAAAYFLYRSVSKTSIGMTVLSIAVGYGYSVIGRRARLFVIPVTVVVICAIATYTSAYLDSISRTYLAPTAFTGRGQIWATLLLYAKDHPMLGSGFESFWNIGDDSPIFIYGHGYVTTVTVGHNGYLDLMASVGVPGVLLIAWAALLWPLYQIVSSERVNIEKGSLLCAMILFCMGHNVTESSLFERDALTGVFTIFTAAFAAYALARGRSGRSGRSGSKNNNRASKAANAVMDEMKARRA